MAVNPFANRLQNLEPDSEWYKHRQALHKLLLQYRIVEAGDLTQADYYHDKVLQYVAYMCLLGVKPPTREE
jgi:hypothetical protein